MRVLAVDIGATKIRLGLADAASISDATPTPQNTDDLIRTVVSSVKAAASRLEFSRIAVACPGLIDRSGRVVASLYLPLSGVLLRKTLEDLLAYPVEVWNDAHAQAVGCIENGESLCYLSFGTGVGGAVVVRGTGLVSGARGFAGELGHVRAVYGKALPCACGRRGCLDSVASGIFLERKLGPKWWTNPSRKARAALGKAGRAAANVASNLSIQLDPERLVLAGHIVKNSEFQRGFSSAWQDPAGIWEFASPEFIAGTWPFASRGLMRLALAHKENP